MTGTFHIKNFDRLQHYKDRSPPWIKLYNGLLDDYAFAHLPDASKAHLLAIGLLASRYSNKIPLDADWIAKRINATAPVDLPTLIKSGFVVPDQDCSTLLASRYQNARPERERETQVQTEKEGEEESICAAPLALTLVDDPCLISFPTNKTGQAYQVLQSHFDQLAPLYPAVDVPQELRAMAAWLISNPKNAKTASGMPRFINSWLSKAQDRSKPNGRAKASRNDNWLAGAADLAAEIRSERG